MFIAKRCHNVTIGIAYWKGVHLLFVLSGGNIVLCWEVLEIYWVVLRGSWGPCKCPRSLFPLWYEHRLQKKRKSPRCASVSSALNGYPPLKPPAPEETYSYALERGIIFYEPWVSVLISSMAGFLITARHGISFLNPPENVRYVRQSVGLNETQNVQGPQAEMALSAESNTSCLGALLFHPSPRAIPLNQGRGLRVLLSSSCTDPRYFALHPWYTLHRLPRWKCIRETRSSFVTPSETGNWFWLVPRSWPLLLFVIGFSYYGTGKQVPP